MKKGFPLFFDIPTCTFMYVYVRLRLLTFLWLPKRERRAHRRTKPRTLTKMPVYAPYDVVAALWRGGILCKKEVPPILSLCERLTGWLCFDWFCLSSFPISFSGRSNVAAFKDNKVKVKQLALTASTIARIQRWWSYRSQLLENVTDLCNCQHSIKYDC